jgi:hypothetical protein
MESAAGATVNLPAPFANATSLTVFENAVADGKKLLPLRYQKPYVDVLEQAVLQAQVVLHSLTPRAVVKRKAVLTQLEMVFSALAAPIAQLRSGNHQKELKAFLAVISDIYRHFVDNRKIRSASKSKLLYPSLDPLGSFNSDSGTGPFTLAATAELPIALVSKPAPHMHFLPLWLVDGHEVGGHSILAGVEGFHTELGDVLEARLRAAFKDGSIETESKNVNFSTGTGTVFSGKTTVSMVDFMVKLWRQWLNEVTADGAGVLNMGPMFADGLILQLALDRPNWELTTNSVFDSRRGFSEHPSDLVRALLTIEMVRQLGTGKSNRYATALAERLDEIQGAVADQIGWVSRNGAIACEVSLADMEAVLPIVADTILKSSLNALSGHSLIGIMPWTDADEKAVRAAASAMLKGDTDTQATLQARHVISGSLLAVERASFFADRFDAACDRVHATGVALLNDMYSNQCLLCNVQTLKGGAKDPADVQLKDLVRLVRKNMHRR